MRKWDAAIPLLSSADINTLGIMMHTVENNAGICTCLILGQTGLRNPPKRQFKAERSDQVCYIPAANKEFKLALNTSLH